MVAQVEWDEVEGPFVEQLTAAVAAGRRMERESEPPRCLGAGTAGPLR
jgi:hypothetical protein